MKKNYLKVAMTFRDKKALKFFREHCSNTKFDRSWAVREIFENYFSKIKHYPEKAILNAFSVDEKNYYGGKYGMSKEKIVVRVSFFDADIIKFLSGISEKNSRAFFIKNVILLYFYNKQEYNFPAVLNIDTVIDTKTGRSGFNKETDKTTLPAQEKEPERDKKEDYSKMLRDF